VYREHLNAKSAAAITRDRARRQITMIALMMIAQSWLKVASSSFISGAHILFSD
jgi:hypothetical protein